jgi:hypothetical protein
VPPGIKNDALSVYWALYRFTNADPEVRLRLHGELIASGHTGDYIVIRRSG